MCPVVGSVGHKVVWGFSGDAVVKESTFNAGDSRDSFLGRKDPLEKEMRTYSSILSWKIPWTEETGRLQLMGSHSIGHN